MKLNFLERMYQEYNELDSKVNEPVLLRKVLDKKEKGTFNYSIWYMKNYREVLNNRINYTKEKYKL